jgi:TolB-like protein/Flp pilus assembly protein TadD
VAFSRPKRNILFWVAGLLIMLAGGYVIFNFLPENSADRRIDSIAVLPFENYSGDPNQEYFVDGMTEALISNLAQINALKVISRTSAMQYKNVNKSVREIARELNVDVILEGSVFQDANRARISVQLIDAVTEKHIWAQKYEREMKDILALHNEVSLAVTREVKIALTEEEQERLSREQEISPEALENYLRGQHHVTRYTMGIGTAADLESGINYYKEAILLEPEWARAHAALAYVYHWYASSQNKPEYYPMSKSAAQQAIALDESISEAHGSLAFVLLNYDWDWEGAAREYHRANELNPNSFAWGTALFLNTAGFYGDAIVYFKRALERNPLSAILQRQLGLAYLKNGQHDLALKHVKKSIDLNANSGFNFIALAQVQLARNQFSEAVAAAEQAVQLEDDPVLEANLGIVYARVGRTTEALKILGKLENGTTDAYYLALAELYTALGKKATALHLIRQADERRSIELLNLKYTGLVDSLKEYPSFRKIMQRINFPEDNFNL